MKNFLVLGAVAYAPKVVTIWEGFKEYFRERNFEMDFVLFSNYERQVESQFDGTIDLAWNSPLAWLRAERMAKARGQKVQAIAMRDTDQDLTSVLVIRSGTILKFSELAGKTIGFGALDSPQASLIPLQHLRNQKLVAGKDYTARHFDILGGKHGDHIGGEKLAAIALMNKEIDAAWMIDSNLLAFSREGIIPAGTTRVLDRTVKYDHCNFTASPHALEKKTPMLALFTELLLAMKWDDPRVRPLLELEGLKAWVSGRASGYEILDQAATSEKFYDVEGNILATDYRY